MDFEKNKEQIRTSIWNKMEEEGVARFPQPIEGRIPNFEGAESAAYRLENLEEFKNADVIKVNPDSPQHAVRSMVVNKGKTLYMPTPRLREGFLKITPDDVPPGKESKATTIKHSSKYGKKVEPEEIEDIDLVVAGSVAVSTAGGRVGKGGGYTDIEYAIIRELDLGKPPVITTVHPLQIVDEIPMEEHDVPMDWILTPEKTIETKTKSVPPGIDWPQVTEEDMRKIPILQKLKPDNI